MEFLVRNPFFTNMGWKTMTVSVRGGWTSYHWRCKPPIPRAESKNSIEPHLSQKYYHWVYRHQCSHNVSKDSNSITQSLFRRLHCWQKSSQMECGIGHGRVAKTESKDTAHLVRNRWRLSCQHQQMKGFCQQAEQGLVREQPPWKVLFFGTDSFSLPHLQVLHQAGKSGHIDRLEVVVPETKFVKRRGRTRRVSPVWKYCEDHELCYRHWPLTDGISGFDLGIIVSFGHLLPEWLIKSFPLGILNVHPSLLPRWRGGAPIQHTILNGDTTTGVSIMRILPDRFDVGPILLQREYKVPERSTSESLTNTLSKMGSEMLIEVMSDVRGFIAKETNQSDDGLTFGRKIPSTLAWVNWNSSVVDIDRLYRAIGGQMPLRTMLGEEELRLEQMVAPQDCSDVALSDSDIPGSVIYHKPKNIVCVRCRDGFVGFSTVAPIGRKRMKAQDFYNGYLSGAKAPHNPVFTNRCTPDR